MPNIGGAGVYWLNLNKHQSNGPPEGIVLDTKDRLNAEMGVIAGCMKYKKFIEKVKTLCNPDWSFNGIGTYYLIWGKGSYNEHWESGRLDSLLRTRSIMDSYGKASAQALVRAGAGLIAKGIAEATTKTWYAFVIIARSSTKNGGENYKQMFRDQRGGIKLGAYTPKMFFSLMTMQAPTSSKFKTSPFDAGDLVEVAEAVISSF